MQRHLRVRAIGARGVVVFVVLFAAMVAPSGALPERHSATTRHATGGSIVFGLEAENATGWCPTTARLNLSGIQVGVAVYDTLVVPNDKGEIVPYLAQSVDHDATYTRWTITLREGVKFHDGTRVTADAVKQNLDAYRRNALIGAGLKDIADVAVNGPELLTVTTARPWVAFPWFLYNDGRLVIVAPAQLADPQTCASHLIGSGPFVFDRWRVNEELVVTRNGDYWRRDAQGGQLPYLDRITFKPVTDAAQRVLELEGGELDLIHTSDGQFVHALEQNASRFRLLHEKRGRRAVRYYLLNVRRPPLDDRMAREAIALAINRREINAVRNRGVFHVANGPFDEDVAGFVKDTGYPKYNPTRAKLLVESYKSAHGGLFSVTIETSNDPAELAEAQLVQEQLRAVGIDVGLKQGDQTTIVADAASGQFSILLWRNHPGNDPDMNYQWWSTGSALNFGGIDDARLQSLLEQGRSELDPVKRTQIYREVNREFASQLFNLWSYRPEWMIAAEKRVHGLGGLTLPGTSSKPLFTGREPLLGIYVNS